MLITSFCQCIFTACMQFELHTFYSLFLKYFYMRFLSLKNCGFICLIPMCAASRGAGTFDDTSYVAGAVADGWMDFWIRGTGSSFLFD